ncbi:uncharacterized protein LACBIDRAFT_159819, partial [Laccaria bicolor S238N-H82]
PLAFAFDIDGVLLRGEDVLPAAKRALRTLEGDNPFKKKIPYILLTNGGGVSEEERCKKLSSQLGVTINQRQYIQAHTIIKKSAHKYANKPVLVLGGKLDKVRKVAESYGFKKAYTTLDVLAWNPAVWPFYDISQGERETTKAVDFSQTPISAIFVFHDPRNWALDVQVICDVILSGGIIGGPPVRFDERTDKQQSVQLIFCNPDLVWRSDFDRPRLGQGAFKEAFHAVFYALTGSTYPHVQYGKPTGPTYAFAQDVLTHELESLYGIRSPLPNMFNFSDNPESDIAGANAANWSSILVRTGVYSADQGPPIHTPHHHAGDVGEAVWWAIEREYR